MSAPDDDTADLRSGPALHDRLLALLPLVGVWRGSGNGVVASSGATFAYTQQISFTHDGRPFLVYDSRSWLVDDTGEVIRPAWRESGFWRPGSTEDELEVLLASNTGQSLLLVGVSGDQRWEVATMSAVPAPTAVRVEGERRLYAVVENELVYATDLAPDGQPYAPHLNARLSRSRE